MSPREDRTRQPTRPQARVLVERAVALMTATDLLLDDEHWPGMAPLGDHVGVGDVRVCLIGDSFVAGVGDPEQLGWAGRLAARSHGASRRAGVPLTAYNLGVRRQTSVEIPQRLVAECAPRLPSSSHCGVVISCGVNDTTMEGSGRRVEPADSTSALDRAVRAALGCGWTVLVVGPPPIADQEHNRRTVEVDAGFTQVCRSLAVEYVFTLAALAADSTWMRQVAVDDGAHPQAEGYAAMTDLVWPHWTRWLHALGG